MITYLKELFGQVLGSLLRNKLRSFLTMSGIAWGIASIVIIVAMGDGFKEGQHNSMRTMGENIAILFGGQTEKQAGGQRAGRQINLTYGDVLAIRQECWRVEYVVGEIESTNRATSPYNSGAFSTDGVEHDFNKLRSVDLAKGRWFSADEDKQGARVAIIGQKVKKQLFAERDPIGREIAVKGLPYLVIGLLADKNQNSSYSSFDEEKMFIPYSAAARDLPPKQAYYFPGLLDDIVYKPRSLQDYEATRKQILAVIGRQHDFDPTDKGAVGVWDTVEDAQQVDSIFESMTVFLSAIALVTLSLGGVGVMNIMLVTVSERTREIGLRKAIGATRHRILVDFLVEGSVLAMVSGTIGWAAAFGLSTLLKQVPMPQEFPGLPVSMTTSALVFTALTVIALLSAFFPAWRAASLTPIEALRYER